MNGSKTNESVRVCEHDGCIKVPVFFEVKPPASAPWREPRRRYMKWCADHRPPPRSKKAEGERTTTSSGYVLVKVGERNVPEHRLVMEEALGRALRPGENVHHINGVRNDNRIENLELWVRPQPPGQRAEQLTCYACDAPYLSPAERQRLEAAKA